jgi:hypothetical protein
LEEEAKTLARAAPDLDALVRGLRENEAALSAEGNDARLRRLEARQEEIGRRRHDLQYSLSRKSSEVAQLEAQSSVHAEVPRLYSVAVSVLLMLLELTPHVLPFGWSIRRHQTLAKHVQARSNLLRESRDPDALVVKFLV